jgi:DNA-binding response OmpR family regulator
VGRNGVERPVVLVVDDDKAIRLLCRVNLEHDGFAVREAPTIGDAREQLAQGDVAVVLLDMHIGRDHGLELLDELAAAESHVPVAVVSGSTDLDGPEYARADAILVKPFTIDQLTATVRTLATR